MNNRNPARELAAMRKLVEFECKEKSCGKTFKAIYRKGPLSPKFCSNKCKQQDKNIRKKGV